MPQKELNELLKKDLWLSSEKCIKYGLVDELWK
jgi:ATP-dependent protease ClpP protease subunit